MKIFKKKQNRACVVGLDGVPYTMLQDLMGRGIMPETRRIAGLGSMRPMVVSLPEISSVSWSTFMTGRNPGEHGIFGFTDLKPRSYDIRFPSFKDLKTGTIWDILGERGLRSVVINQPSTYPAREVPGVLISGFVAIDLAKALYPRRYLASLTRAQYKIDVDMDRCRDNPERLFAALDRTLTARRKIVDELWDKEDWSLMEIVVTGTDRVQHFVWDAYEDESHPHREAFLDYYRKVDTFIGHVHRKFSDENFFLLSDHGFCQTRQEFYVNTLLEREGYLDIDPAAKGALTGITEKTRAFALDPARIYIHRRGRYPNGSVDEGDVTGLKKELTEMFDSYEWDGANGREKVVRRVFDAADVYSGPHAGDGPDLLLIPHNGFDMKGRTGMPEPMGQRRLQGMHTWDNAFFFSQRADLLESDVRAGAGGNLSHDLADTNSALNIIDAPWMILRSLDIEI